MDFDEIKVPMTYLYDSKHICNALIKNHHVASIFYNHEKAYDTTWR